jgi:hypothetical protein
LRVFWAGPPIEFSEGTKAERGRRSFGIFRRGKAERKERKPFSNKTGKQMDNPLEDLKTVQAERDQLRKEVEQFKHLLASRSALVR